MVVARGQLPPVEVDLTKVDIVLNAVRTGKVLLEDALADAGRLCRLTAWGSSPFSGG